MPTPKTIPLRFFVLIIMLVTILGFSLYSNVVSVRLNKQRWEARKTLESWKNLEHLTTRLLVAKDLEETEKTWISAIQNFERHLLSFSRLLSAQEPKGLPGSFSEDVLKLRRLWKVVKSEIDFFRKNLERDSALIHEIKENQWSLLEFHRVLVTERRPSPGFYIAVNDLRNFGVFSQPFETTLSQVLQQNEEAIDAKLNGMRLVTFGLALLILLFTLVYLHQVFIGRTTAKALAQSQKRMQLIIESSPMGIRIVQEGRYQYVNPAFIKMFDYDREQEILGRPVEVLYIAEDQERIKRRHRDEMSGKSMSSSYEVTGIKKSGKTFEVAVWTTSIDYEGKPAVLGFLIDISDAKRLRSRLQRAEKMEALGTLAGGVAHDLNNVLSGLVSYPDLMLMDLPDDSPLREPVMTIKSSGERAAAIVQDLLTLARRGVTVTEVVNVNDLILEYLHSSVYMKLKSYYPNIIVETDLAVDLLPILASPVHVSNTIMNLVSNAAEAASEDGRITITTANRYVDTPIKGYEKVKEGDYAVMTVTDDGVGISPEDLERIFEPFYTKKVMGRSGTGLGMAVVWGTLRDHNGYIDINSAEGQGTSIDLYFPVTRKRAEREGSTRSIQECMGNGERVLVVDDVEEQREIAAMLLSKLGYNADVVSSGEEAVTYMKTKAVDLLILDMIMDPGMDGLDTYREILALHPGQKAIIASGYSETDRVKEAQRLGAGQYVKKPYTLEKIGLAVKAALDQ